MERKLARALLCGLGFAGIVSAQTPAEDRLRARRTADSPAELRRLSRALAADERIPGGPEKRGPRPPRRGPRKQREQLSVSPHLRAPPTECRCRPPARCVLNRSPSSKRGSTRAPTGPTRSLMKPTFRRLNPKAVALVETLRTDDLAGVHEVRHGRSQAVSTPAGRRVPRLSCTRCSTPAEPTLERLLKQGADPNKQNDADATALMWAADRSRKNPASCWTTARTSTRGRATCALR